MNLNRLYLVLWCFIFLLGCNNESKPSVTKTDSVVLKETPVYPFTARSSLNWQPGDENWVTLWYTEIMTDKKGKVDSIYYTDDVLAKNGKILVYDEKQRRF